MSHLIEENKTKTKTKHIQYEKVEMQRYLSQNQNTKIAKVIFNIRAGTFDIKSLNQWKYKDNLCIMCSVKEENLKHFMTCKFYKRNVMNIDDIYSNDIEKQFKIGEEAVYRKDIREIKKTRGWPGLSPGSHCSRTFVLLSYSGINMMMMMT